MQTASIMVRIAFLFLLIAPGIIADCVNPSMMAVYHPEINTTEIHADSGCNVTSMPNVVCTYLPVSNATQTACEKAGGKIFQHDFYGNCKLQGMTAQYTFKDYKDCFGKDCSVSEMDQYYEKNFYPLLTTLMNAAGSPAVTCEPFYNKISAAESALRLTSLTSRMIMAFVSIVVPFTMLQ